jgi:hypothetical protein
VATLGADGRVVQEDALVFGYRTNGWFVGTTMNFGSSSVPSTDGTIYGLPCRIYSAVTIDRISMNVVGLGFSADTVYRLGIYKVNADGTKSLVIDAGTTLVSTTGIKSITISPTITLTTGIYILVGVRQGGTGGATVTANAAWSFDLVDSDDAGMYSSIVIGYILQTGVTGALPATIANTSLGYTNRPLAILLRKA